MAVCYLLLLDLMSQINITFNETKLRPNILYYN